MASPLTLLLIPLRLFSDIRRIAEYAADLPAVRGLMSDMSADLAELRVVLGVLPPQLEQVTGELEGFRDTLGGMSRRLDEAIVRLGPLDEEVPGMLREMRDELDGLRSDLSRLPFIPRRAAARA